jgi:AcrR family transcriptional regulator
VKAVRKKRPYHHGDLARALKDAALELVAEEGLDAFTLREAARRVGVHHAAAYRHYAKKDDLLAAVAEEGFVVLGDRVRAAAARHDDLMDAVRATAGAYVAFALGEPARFRVMLGPRLNRDGSRPTLEAAGQNAFKVLLDLVARADLDPPRERALSIWTMAHGFAELYLRERIRARRWTTSRPSSPPCLTE